MDLPANVDTVHLGKHEIQDHQGWRIVYSLLEPTDAVLGPVELVADVLDV